LNQPCFQKITEGTGLAYEKGAGVLNDQTKGSFMKNQIEFSFRGDEKSCSRARYNGRAKWARLWFTRMREMVAEAEDQTLFDEHEQNQPADWPGKK
jgi:hypothetical protein